MQKQKIHSRRHTQNSTQFSVRDMRHKQHIRLRSVQSQLEKKKFAAEYAKLTKQFRNILTKSKKQISKVDIRTQRFIEDKNNKLFSNQETIEKSQNKKQIKKIAIAQKNNQQSVRNNKQRLQNLYSNRLHEDIKQTAEKIVKAKRQKINSIYLNQSPTSKPKLNSASYINYQSPLNLRSEQNIIKQQQMYIHLQKQKDQKINSDFNNIPQILAHFHNLYKIRELLDDYKNNYALMIKNIRKYVMNHNRADVNKLQNLLKIQKQKDKLRIFLCVQKIVIVGILDSMLRQYEIAVSNEGKIIFDAIMGVYMSVLSYIITEGIYKKRKNSKRKSKQTLQEDTLPSNDINNQKYKDSIQTCLQLLQTQGIQKKKDLQSTTQYIFKRCQNLFKYNLSLFHKIKQIFTQVTKIQITINTSRISFNNMNIYDSNKSGVTFININRFFYYLLCEYARNLNNAQNAQLMKIHKNLLDFFVTCPSPHLVYAPTHKTTVVIQLQNSLAMIKVNNSNSNMTQLPQSNLKKGQNIKYIQQINQNATNKQIYIKLRPHAQQFISELSKIGEVIIITSLMPQSIPVPTKHLNGGYKDRDRQREKQVQSLDRILKMASSLLFRYHYVRYRGLLVKDISRLGRNMENIILIQSMDLKNINNNSKSTNSQLKSKQKIIQELPQTNMEDLNVLSTHLYVENMMPISIWKGNSRDRQLLYLKDLLTKIIIQKTKEKDVRNLLKKYKLNLTAEEEGNIEQNRKETIIQIKQQKQQPITEQMKQGAVEKQIKNQQQIIQQTNQLIKEESRVKIQIDGQTYLGN